MKCPRCGGNNFGWARRCDECGEPLQSTAASESSGGVTVAREAVTPSDAEAGTSAGEENPSPAFESDSIVSHTEEQADLQTPAPIRPPVVMLTLLAINLIVFVSMVMSGVSAFEPAVDALLRWGASYGPAVTHGEWWRLGTAMFLHIGVLHLIMNMYVLFIAGAISERLFGSASFAVLYALTGLAGSVTSLWWHPDAVGAGASGAIFGLYGGLIGFLMARRRDVSASALQPLLTSGLTFVIGNLAIGALNPRIDMAAHFGGWIAGVPVGLALAQPRSTPVAGRLVRAALVTVAGLAAIAAAAARAPVTDDLPAELTRVSALEEKTNAELRTSLANVGTSMTTDEFAIVVEQKILPPWRRQRDALAALSVPDDKRDLQTKLVRYMTLRAEAWQLSARAMQTDNAGIGRAASAKAEEAAVALYEALPSESTKAALESLRTARDEREAEAAVLSRVEAFEKRIVGVFNGGLAALRAGRLAPRDFANQITGVIIPLLDQEARAYQPRPGIRPSEAVKRVRSYLAARREAFEMTAAGIEKNDAELVQRGQARAAEAMALMRGGTR